MNRPRSDPRAADTSDPATHGAVHLEYAGPALTAGTIDAGELGTALYSVGALISRAYQNINGSSGIIGLTFEIRARSEPGAFDVLLEMLLGRVSPLAPERKGLSYILTLIGFADTGEVQQIGTTLLKFLKWLKDKAITQKEVNLHTGTVVVTAADNAHAEVHSHVVLLAEDPRILQAVNDLLQPLRKPGVETVRFKQEERVVEEVRKNEIPVLPVVLPDPTLIPGERVTYVEIVRPAFRENMAWEFTEGGPTFSAMVKDPIFLDRVAHRVRMFRKGDVLRVKLKTEPTQTPQGLRTERIIVEVLLELPRGVRVGRMDAEGIKPKQLLALSQTSSPRSKSRKTTTKPRSRKRRKRRRKPRNGRSSGRK